VANQATVIYQLVMEKAQLAEENEALKRRVIALEEAAKSAEKSKGGDG
jgi:hypothetical protein